MDTPYGAIPDRLARGMRPQEQHEYLQLSYGRRRVVLPHMSSAAPWPVPYFETSSGTPPSQEARPECRPAPHFFRTSAQSKAMGDAVVGVVANPLSGRDIRRLVTQASVLWESLSATLLKRRIDSRHLAVRPGGGEGERLRRSVGVHGDRQAEIGRHGRGRRGPGRQDNAAGREVLARVGHLEAGDLDTSEEHPEKRSPGQVYRDIKREADGRLCLSGRRANEQERRRERVPVGI
jgi:hypothetical protein